LLLVSSDDCVFAASAHRGLKEQPGQVIDALCSAVFGARREATPRGLREMTTVLLTDGLSGTGEEIVRGLFEQLQSGAQIVGGAAGDEAKFKKTLVGTHADVSSDAAAALTIFGKTPWGVGVGHGLRPTTRPMRVTAAKGNVVHEIDGVPAFQVYREHALERGIKLTPEAASPYLIGNELGIHFFDTIARARAPLSVGPDGSLSCAAEIPMGSMVSILDGDPDSMVEAAKAAAQEAKDRLGDHEVAGVLLFDCVCRGMILGDRFGREIDAVRSVFGKVPVAGFLTYGEIARYGGRLDGWHNATAVVTAIPA
jgi:hypothetical protein